jgi:predicted nucleotidyltransferase
MLTASLSLDLPPRHLQEVLKLLRIYVPEKQVWAYGSRVTGSGHEASDLDLVLLDPLDMQAPTSAIYDLKEAFVDSNLPIRVDVMDWARIPATFHREIERAHVLLQEGRQNSKA